MVTVIMVETNPMGVMMEVLNIMNILDADIRIPGFTATTERRVLGSPDVFRPVTAVFCDKKSLSPFHAIKRRVDRLCLASGTRLCGGYAIPDACVVGVLAQVKIEQERFEMGKAEFLATWPLPVESWIKAHPAEEADIRAVAPDKATLAVGLACDIRVFKVSSSSDVLAKAGIQDGLSKQVSAISAQVAGEIAVEARNTWKRRSEKKASNQEIRKSLHRWAGKLRNLSFLDPVFLKVEATIADGLAKLPASGMIEGADFLLLSGLMGLLMNPETMFGSVSANIGEQVPEDDGGIKPLFNW